MVITKLHKAIQLIMRTQCVFENTLKIFKSRLKTLKPRFLYFQHVWQYDEIAIFEPRLSSTVVHSSRIQVASTID